MRFTVNYSTDFLNVESAHLRITENFLGPTSFYCASMPLRITESYILVASFVIGGLEEVICRY